MNDTLQETNVSEAFSRQSIVFDAIDDSNDIIIWMRNRIRNEVNAHINPCSQILELNCGTGIDSIYFAKNGHKILATDNAPGMLRALNEKVTKHQLQDSIETFRCSFNNLENIQGKQFDYIFSNFGGLNCTDNLEKILIDIQRLLKPGGYFSLVIMPKICPWEILMLFRGYFKTAFRRILKNGSSAHLEGKYFQCYYYNPSYITKRLKHDFELVTIKGLSISVPPPYIEHFIERHPKLFKILEKIENQICQVRPFCNWGDHYIITMQKKLL